MAVMIDNTLENNNKTPATTTVKKLIIKKKPYNTPPKKKKSPKQPKTKQNTPLKENNNKQTNKNPTNYMPLIKYLSSDYVDQYTFNLTFYLALMQMISKQWRCNSTYRGQLVIVRKTPKQHPPPTHTHKNTTKHPKQTNPPPQNPHKNKTKQQQQQQQQKEKKRKKKEKQTNNNKTKQQTNKQKPLNFDIRFNVHIKSKLLQHTPVMYTLQLWVG